MSAGVKPVTTLAGTPFEYLVNLATGVVHARRTCSGLGRGGDAGSMISRETQPDPTLEACAKCVPAKCLTTTTHQEIR